MIPNSFSSIAGANFELLAALNQSITLFRKSFLQIDDYENYDQLNLSHHSRHSSSALMRYR